MRQKILFQNFYFQVLKLLPTRNKEPHRKLRLNGSTRQIALVKCDSGGNIFNPASKPQCIDIAHIREAIQLSVRERTQKIFDKWRQNKEIPKIHANQILCIKHGAAFVLNEWILHCT